MNYAAAASKGSASRATAPPPSANGSKKLNKKKSTEKPKSNGRESAETKSPTSAPPPGFAPSSANSGQAPPKGFSESQQRLLRHRALFVFRFLVGKAVEVQLVDSSRYVGILDCIDPDDFSIVLKNTQRKGASHGESFDSGSTVIFKRRQLAHISADGVVDYSETTVGTGAAAGAPGFRTDTEISGRSHEHLYGRELQSASSWLDPQLDTGSLEDSRRRGPSGKSAWNQFEANEKLFGVVSTFDENLYTTKLDRGKLSTEQSREAERIAREIERETTGNFHLQEERGQRVEREDLDEEALYSSVDRKAAASPATRAPNAYVPPALRNASRQSSGSAASAAKSTTTSESKPTAAAPAASASPAAPSAPAPVTAPANTPTAPPSGTRKAISFSEAVTGRPAATAAATAPVSAKPAAHATTAPTKTEVATSSPKAKAPTSANAQKADAKATAAAPASATKKSKESKAADTVEAKAAPDASKKSNDGASATAPAAKKGLNPNAKEFKLSAAAPEFTPKFMSQPSATSSPYRQPYQAPAGQMYPPPPMGMGYAPMPEEWMYDGSGMMEEGGEYMHAAYMGYGVPMMPNPAMMQQPVYPPMMPQPNVRMMAGAGGQRVPSGGNYGYPHPHHPTQPGAYNARGYYQGAAPGAMPYAGAPGSASPGVPPQPPLPREPTPGTDAVSNGKAPPSEEPSPAESSQKAGSAKGDAALAQRVAALELENERFRDELAHLRHLVSNNHQQRDDERLTVQRVTEELQRLAHSVQAKAQADAAVMQREQHKAALLFAEVARIGQHVESVELGLRTVSDELHRKLMNATHQPLGLSPTKRSTVTDVHASEIAVLRAAVNQLQSDAERDRSAQMALDAERTQWMADMRAALARNEAAVEAKTASHLERLAHRMAADKMELVRLVEETRELLAGADLRRVSGHLSAFSRLSDHLLSLERWLHTELSNVKRVCQLVLSDCESRTTALLSELRTAGSCWFSMLQHVDDDWRDSWMQLHDAVLELATHVQNKLFALEDVVPMEVKARQKHDDKLRRRVESVVKSMTKAIETVQREVHDLSSSTARCQERQLAMTDDHERLETVERALTALSAASSQDPTGAATAGSATIEDMSWREELDKRLAAVVEEISRRENDVLSKIETVESEHGEVLAALQQWSASHAVECRQYFEYLSWKMESAEDEMQVTRCVRSLVDAVANEDRPPRAEIERVGGGGNERPTGQCGH